MYSHSCEDCAGVVLPDLVDDTWDDIYTQIANDLLTEDANFNADLYYKTAGKLMDAVYKGLGASYFSEDDSRNDLLNAFKINLEAFSYAKTLTQFKHFKDLMFDDKGKILNAVELKKVVADQGAIFNNRYLNVEHQFVTQSAIMAHKWDSLNSEYLEFTTVGDGKVRPEHKLFDKFTALKTDPIWKRLYTPLNWNCRCTIIPGIEKNLSKVYNSEWADKMVDPLVKNTIFDNNVGITKVIFTDKHPYFKEDISKKKEVDSATNQDYKVLNKEDVFLKQVNKSKSLLDQYPNHTIEELGAIKHYSGSGYYNLNIELNKGKLSNFNQSLETVLNKGLDKLPKNDFTNKVLYRGAGLEYKYIEKYKNYFESGKTKVEKSFWSTTDQFSVAEEFSHNDKSKKKVVFEIFDTKSAKNIADISVHDYENEYLFKSKSKFKVIGFKEIKGKYETSYEIQLSEDL